MKMANEQGISEVTRRAIVDAIILEDVSWAGSLGDVDFLNRMFDLKSLPSTDGRYSDAASDIWKHRIANSDWDDQWIFSDSRFGLMHGPDEVFLRFLCEMVHPLVRQDKQQVLALVKLFNQHLIADGWEIVERTAISGRPVFSARRLLPGVSVAMNAVRTVQQAVDADYLTQQITRLESAIDTDPALAIGTAKEFVETVCKTILDERGVAYNKGIACPELVRAVTKELKLTPDDIPEQTKVTDIARRILSNLATVANGLTELRNFLGTGHGKQASAKGPPVRHARLAVGAAATLAVFLFETHQERPRKP